MGHRSVAVGRSGPALVGALLCAALSWVAFCRIDGDARGRVEQPAPRSVPAIANGPAARPSVASDAGSADGGGGPALPEAPAPPSRPAPLRVLGFAPASHVGPDDASGWPRPVVVVLHGNYDRPEWECDTWKDAAGFHGWILCPRGVRTPWASLSEDRWTYRGRGPVRREIEAALGSLEDRYPGRVSRDDTVLAGFSLGAILAPGLAEADPGAYPYLFLVEGGVEKLDRKRLRSLSRSGVRGIGLAMSAPGRIRLARDAVARILSVGMGAVFVDMRGAGHGYRGDFGRTGREGLGRLVAGASDGGVAEVEP